MGQNYRLIDQNIWSLFEMLPCIRTACQYPTISGINTSHDSYEKEFIRESLK